MRADGALTATIGTVVGSLVLGGAGLSLWLLPCDETGLDCLGPAILGGFAAMGGIVGGSFLGCYVALRIRKRVRAGATIAVLLGLGAGAAIVSLVLSLVGAPSGLVEVIAGAAWLGLPSVARRIVIGASEKDPCGASDAPVEI